MSSVQSYLRQRVVGTTTFSTDGVTQLYCLIAGNAAAGGLALAVDAAGNYVGNYPPGYLVNGPTVANLAVGDQGGVTNPVLRDLGKTIYAPLADAVSATLFGTPGYWRAVQVLDPSFFVGGTADGNSGITGQAPGFRPVATGGNNGDKGYNTYYLPIVMNGTVPGSAATTSVPLTPVETKMILGGVM
jgi:hypothetical protein